VKKFKLLSILFLLISPLFGNIPVASHAQNVPTASDRFLYLPLAVNIVHGTAPDDYLALIHPDGSREVSFDAEVWAPGGVAAILVQSDGNILVAGQLSTLDHPNLSVSRLTPSGDFDFEFMPRISGQVYAMAIQPDGKIIVGGDFTAIDGVERNRIARLTSSGDLDMTFEPGIGPDATVRAIAVQGDGKIIIGGTFKNVANFPRDGIARLNSDGSLDTSFQPDIQADIQNGDGVTVIEAMEDGRILLGGRFIANNTEGLPAVRLNDDGSLDNSFDASDLLGSTNCWAIQDDGKFILGGKFNKRDEYGIEDVVRIDSDGDFDSTFKPYKFGYSFQISTWVHTILVENNGKVLVGGGEFIYPFSTYYYVLVRLGSDGVLENHIQHVFESPSGLKSVEALAGYFDDLILVGATTLR
jgi:uncharacterized delta-60 repeat protein